MRFTLFNEPVLQPGDDITAIWFDRVGDIESEVGLTARFLEEDDGKWGCELFDEDGNTLSANDFTSESELRAWLTSQEVEIED